MSAENRIIYFISEAFPPLGRGGSIISAHFARYLCESGWDVRVITDGKRKGFFLKWEYDYGLYEELNKLLKIEIVQPFMWRMFGEIGVSLGFSPSMFMGWVRKVRRNLAGIIDPNKKAIVMAMYPDIANLYVGLEIKKRYGFPFVLNLRDVFRSNLVEGRLKDRLWKIEKEFVEFADFIFVATETIRQNVSELFGYDNSRIGVIYNGYGEKLNVSHKPLNPERMKIVYAGTIAEAQKPEILNLAYRLLIQRHPELKDKIEIDVYGQRGYYFKTKYRKTLCDGINFKGFLPYQKLMETLEKEADIGFFSLADEKFSYAMPTKLFDFINLEKPILASLPDGEAKSIIEKYHIGKVAHYNDIEGLANLIYEYFANPSEIEKHRENIRAIKDKFSIKYQVERMSRILLENVTL